MTDNGKDKFIDRRQDVGQKMFVAIVSAILTTVLVSVLSLGWRNYERSNIIEIRVVQLEAFARNQDTLNKKLTDFLESGERWMLQQKFKQQGGA
jgi:hypothetical protein